MSMTILTVSALIMGLIAKARVAPSRQTGGQAA